MIAFPSPAAGLPPSARALKRSYTRVIMPADALPLNDLGHQGEVDITQIEKMLRLTPTQRLRKHESWRLFARKALSDAKLRREGPGSPDSGRR